jgi:N utilization substance protein A
LSPAKVVSVTVIDQNARAARVVVPDFQLSLAIGKEGQNARLAARLTGWRIDIKSETQLEEEAAYEGQDWAEGEWVEDESGEMVWKPAEGGDAISAEQWSHAAEEQAEEAGAEPTGSAEKAEVTTTADTIEPDTIEPDTIEAAEPEAAAPEAEVPAESSVEAE